MKSGKFDEKDVLWTLLWELCNKLEYRFPQLRESLKDPTATGTMRDMARAFTSDNMEGIARALTTQLPPLQRVLTFSMWMSRDFVRNVAGITDAELEEIKEKVAKVRVWPAQSITVQQWNTHTVVVFDDSCQKTIYESKPWDDLVDPTTIWQHTFGQNVDGPCKDGILEVVFHQRAIKCWARNGRFKGKYWSHKSEDEYLFITIPLEDDKLNSFLVPDNDDSVEPPYRYESQPWDKMYHCENNERGIGWDLHILDNIAREINWW
jgi:hypothetical protein